MTAQAYESLLFNGNEMSMATEPLKHYLQNRNDINFISPTTACWRGYYGQWEVKGSELYLIGLNAYIEGYREVGLNYLFPNQTEVLANWFNGEIRIPQGEMLEYRHLGYLSMYESDLFLVFENGILVNQYEVDNRAEYQNRLKLREKELRERPAKEAKEKREESIITFFAISTLILGFIGICIGIFFLIKWGTLLGYVISTILTCGVFFLLYRAIENQRKNKRKKKTFIKLMLYAKTLLGEFSIIFILTFLSISLFIYQSIGDSIFYDTDSTLMLFLKALDIIGLTFFSLWIILHFTLKNHYIDTYEVKFISKIRSIRVVLWYISIAILFLPITLGILVFFSHL